MISFAIVNWNGGKVFKNCIASIYGELQRLKIQDYEIIVVDNNSDDLEIRWLNSCKNLKLIRNSSNLLFSKATNQSVEASSGEILFILNNDIILKKNCLKFLLEELKSPKIDAVIPKLLYPNGKIQKSIVGLPTLKDVAYAAIGLNFLNKRFDSWLNNRFDFSKRSQVYGQPAFSALLIKRKSWDRVGSLDIQFPLLWNDTDWFFRFQRLKLRCFYIPSAEASHVHGMSVNRRRINKIIQSVKCMRRYFIKNHQLSTWSRCCLNIISVQILILGIAKELAQLAYLRVKTRIV